MLSRFSKIGFQFSDVFMPFNLSYERQMIEFYRSSDILHMTRDAMVGCLFTNDLSIEGKDTIEEIHDILNGVIKNFGKRSMDYSILFGIIPYHFTSDEDGNRVPDIPMIGSGRIYYKFNRDTKRLEYRWKWGYNTEFQYDENMRFYVVNNPVDGKYASDVSVLIRNHLYIDELKDLAMIMERKKANPVRVQQEILPPMGKDQFGNFIAYRASRCGDHEMTMRSDAQEHRDYYKLHGYTPEQYEVVHGDTFPDEDNDEPQELVISDKHNIFNTHDEDRSGPLVKVNYEPTATHTKDLLPMIRHFENKVSGVVGFPDHDESGGRVSESASLKKIYVNVRINETRMHMQQLLTHVFNEYFGITFDDENAGMKIILEPIIIVPNSMVNDIYKLADQPDQMKFMLKIFKLFTGVNIPNLMAEDLVSNQEMRDEIVEPEDIDEDGKPEVKTTKKTKKDKNKPTKVLDREVDKEDDEDTSSRKRKRKLSDSKPEKRRKVNEKTDD
jgi:hypothetical protein